MSSPRPHPPDGTPAWCAGASRRHAFARGSVLFFSIPGLILFASASGFGALARDAGFSLGNSVLMMAAFFALPAQVVFTDQLARGGSLAAGALAVSLTGIRLLPMAVTLVPFLKIDGAPRWRAIVAIHAVAVTAWIEGLRRLPHIPDPLRLSFFLGLGAGFIGATLAGTALGYEIAGAVPSSLAATLLFLTPIYFFLSLLATARIRCDWLAILFGAILGPLFYLLIPGFDLLATGLVGGTLAYWLGAKRRVSKEAGE